MSLAGVPVDHGAVLAAVTSAGFGSLALSLGRHPRRWKIWGLCLFVTLAVAYVIGQGIGIDARVGSSFPPSFYVWAALPVATLVATLWRPREPGSPPRWLGALAGGLLVLFAVGQVNAQYSYLPTVGDVLGFPLPDQVPGPAAMVAARPGLPHGAATAQPAHGVVLSVRIPPAVSNFETRSGYVWLPPAYFRRPRPVLPVVVMLAGVPGNPSNLLRGGHAEQVADAFAAGHGGLAPILVFPDHNGSMWNDSECVDGPRGNAETYLTVDVPAYVSRTFGTSSGGPSWGIVGYSEGGTCALTLALRHPSLFPSFVDIGGDLRPNARSSREPPGRTITALYGGRADQWAAHDPLALLQHSGSLDATFVVGNLDGRARDAARQLNVAATEANVPTRLVSVPGKHSFAMVSRAIAATLPTLSVRLLDAAGDGVGSPPTTPWTLASTPVLIPDPGGTMRLGQSGW